MPLSEEQHACIILTLAVCLPVLGATQLHGLSNCMLLASQGPISWQCNLAAKCISIHLCLQEKVYAGAEAQAQLFMEYIQSSRDQSVDDDFDFDGEREYDGGSYDSAFAGNTRHNQT